MNEAVEIPQYKSHKTVRAAKITAIQDIDVDGALLALGEIGGTVTKNREWISKHTPEVGGYYVVYDDGYASYSPGTAFENGYSKI